MKTDELLAKALGDNLGHRRNGKAVSDAETVLKDFLLFNPNKDKLEQHSGEIRLEVAGPMWKAQMISHMAWRKKTCYVEDLAKLVEDLALALADGAIPLEQYRSQKQRKDPDKIKE